MRPPFQFNEFGGHGFPGGAGGAAPTLPAPPVKRANGNGDTRRGASSNGEPFWFGGYDAVKHKGRRATPLARTQSEDLELRQLPRRQLTSGIRDLNRNFAVAAWMIRRHLDYIATFHFRPKTGNPDVDRQLVDFMTWWSQPQNCDAAGRHSLPRLMRMWEIRRVIDGDVLINRLADGTLQTIEGDRIQTFGGVPFEDLGIEDPRYVVNGVWINEMGRSQAYMVFKRLPWWTGLQWDKMVPARFADLLGYYDRTDQVRGISPLAAAVNTLRDVYEGLDYALVKAKVSQFFAMLFTRAEPDQIGNEQIKEGESLPDQDPEKTRYDIDLGKGPVLLDMDAGDDAKIIESAQPSDQWQAFEKLSIMVALKALDIPFSFFDESHTNYSGSRMAGVQYFEACKSKQHDLRAQIDKVTRWRVGLAIADGDIILPAGFQLRQLKWEFSHAGTPLYDPLKEISASIAAINAGLSSHEREAKKLGLDVYELIDEIERVQSYAKKKGVILSTALASMAQDDPNKQTTKTETENVEDDSSAATPDDGKPGSGGRQNIWGNPW